MSAKRTFLRDQIRKHVRNENLQYQWQLFQKHKYHQWYKRVCKPKGKKYA